MNVIGLCDNLLKAVRIYKELKDIESINLYLLVCKNLDTGIVRYFLGHLYYFFKMNIKDKLLFTSIILRGTLRISSLNLYHEKILTWVKNKKPDIGLHAMGVIYKNSVISLFRLGIANPHIGLLPKYRGRSVMEWSIFNGDPTGISTFFIDRGIDTGRRVILLEEIDISKFKDIITAKNYLFSLDLVMFRKAIEKLLNQENRYIENEVCKGERYYVMSKLFSIVVERIMQFNSSG